MTTELSIGTVRETDRPAHLEATRLNRHTFWCGQSGSGKTYALGVLLEQVLLHTALPIIVLDPNADFVRMSEVRPDAPAEDAATLATRDIRVLSVTPSPAQELLQVRFLDLPGRSRTAILQLDPVLDAEDFHTALEIEADLRGGLDQPLLPYLRSSDDPGRHRIAMRLQNLGVADWQALGMGRQGRHGCRGRAPGRDGARPGRISHVGRDAGGGPGRARPPLGAPPGASRAAGGHRRGAQPLPAGPLDAVAAGPGRAHHPDRGRRAQIRHLARCRLSVPRRST
ncbi:helicase HerA domain-containing protein [Microbacterium elymi]|uniref:DUF87 domain-containing protein n=1 Tax=Microbacterium elymi TaxID=2909587 RepID=A0ABY5NL42_9MICO|nr:DUF87 domain-containing protein [Microbacterium elymi]UUT35900.1 DUF87 domain-containing protein [Microbacterium elymi]